VKLGRPSDWMRTKDASRSELVGECVELIDRKAERRTGGASRGVRVVVGTEPNLTLHHHV
jgi:hypothetical protein